MRQFTAEDVKAARRELARISLPDFASMVDIPTVPLTDAIDEDSFSVMRLGKLATHHQFLLERLQDIDAGRLQNLMVLMPPGSAKSTYCDVVFVPWFMRRPRRNVILASYASEIAEKQGRRARQLIKSKSFHNLMQLSLRDDNRAAHQWTLDNGSEFMAGGILSGLTGNRGALGILDDPIKGRAEAESETIRQKTWEAYLDDFTSRLIPGAPQIHITTRWHEDDPAGRILPEKWDGQSGDMQGRDGRKWHVICLPAIADRYDDPLGRKLGETLWPEWFSHEHWAPFQANRRTWSSLYQQKPSPDEGTFFREEWFKRYRIGDQPRILHHYLTSDHAPAGESVNDFACVRVWGIDAQGDVWLRDGFREQLTMDKLCDRVLGRSGTPDEPALVGLVERYRPLAWFPEDDNNWKSCAGFVQRIMRERNVYCRVEPISPHGADKPTKAQAFQGFAASGRVHLPAGPDGDDILAQYKSFPTATHDDEVDAASLIGRAIANAHPAIIPVTEAAKWIDRWDAAFNRDAEKADSEWKTV